MDQIAQDYIRYLLEQRANLELQVLKLTEDLKQANEVKPQEPDKTDSGS